MLPHHSTLEAFLQKKSKTELIKIISDTYQLSHGKITWDLFGDILYEVQLNSLDAGELRQKVENFYKESLQGKYYVSFSKSIMEIPEATDNWFNELSLLLDLCCELVFRGEKQTAGFCFHRLFEII